MLSDNILNIYKQIITHSLICVEDFIDSSDLTGNINFASIYARSDSEYEIVNRELKENGSVFDAQNSGTYYKLNNSINISGKTITICRVRKYDTEHSERGYCDFEVINYKKFSRKYSKLNFFSVLENQHGIEMVELRVPKRMSEFTFQTHGLRY